MFCCGRPFTGRAGRCNTRNFVRVPRSVVMYTSIHSKYVQQLTNFFMYEYPTEFSSSTAGTEESHLEFWFFRNCHTFCLQQHIIRGELRNNYDNDNKKHKFRKWWRPDRKIFPPLCCRVWESQEFQSSSINFPWSLLKMDSAAEAMMGTPMNVKTPAATTVEPIFA